LLTLLDKFTVEKVRIVKSDNHMFLAFIWRHRVFIY